MTSGEGELNKVLSDADSKHHYPVPWQKAVLLCAQLLRPLWYFPHPCRGKPHSADVNIGSLGERSDMSKGTGPRQNKDLKCSLKYGRSQPCTAQ